MCRERDKGKKKLDSEIVQVIKAHKSAGLTGYEVAQMLGIGKSSAYKYTRKKSYPRWSDDEKQIVIDCLARKMTTKKIAKKVGRTQAAVKHIIHKHRKLVKGNQDIRVVTALIMKCVGQGLTPGKAISAIRRHDLFSRMRDMCGKV
jgi:predicted transcriptional regulator